METKKAYQEKMEAHLKEWSAKIGELMAKAEKAQADAKIEYQREVEELQVKQKEVEQNLKKLRQAGEEAWEDWKTGVQKAWDDLQGAWESAVARFK